MIHPERNREGSQRASVSYGVHESVLLNEVVEYLNLKPGNKVIDATFGAGGHALAILEKIRPGGKLLGIEIDREFFDESKKRFAKIPEIILVNASFADLEKIAKEFGFINADGILFDIGLSSWHLERSKRGFTFTKDEPLDMRFSAKGKLTAREIVNQWPPEAIEKILREYGEERFARAITGAIVEARKEKPIISTFQLIEVMKKALPLWYRSGRRVHFATKTFQALRIAVNDELGNLAAALKQLPKVLKAGGRGLVISFHSLEDRIVKQNFRELKNKGIAEIITKKPVRPEISEVIKNPRSRSAKLRVLEIKSNKI